MNRYQVNLRSVPGMIEQYSGHVEVDAVDDDDAIERAFAKLRAGAFPDRDRSMWRVESVERVR